MWRAQNIGLNCSTLLSQKGKKMFSNKELNQKLPKYFQIASRIVHDIENGLLVPGMRVPSENEIMNEYQVSNTTARKALQHIETQGFVKKIKGKGTFVQKKGIERTLGKILSFTKNIRESGMKPSTKVLEQKIIKNGYSADINGRIYKMKEPVLCIKRLRFANEIPMMFETRYISTIICKEIENNDFEGSLYELYEKKYHLKLSEINQMLSASVAKDEKVMRYFNAKESMPVFVVDGVTFIGKEMILEMEESIYRGDKYRFSVRAV